MFRRVHEAFARDGEVVVSNGVLQLLKQQRQLRHRRCPRRTRRGTGVPADNDAPLVGCFRVGNRCSTGLSTHSSCGAVRPNRAPARSEPSP